MSFETNIFLLIALLLVICILFCNILKDASLLVLKKNIKFGALTSLLTPTTNMDFVFLSTEAFLECIAESIIFYATSKQKQTTTLPMFWKNLNMYCMTKTNKKAIKQSHLYQTLPWSAVNDCSSSVPGDTTLHLLKTLGVEASWLSTAFFSNGVLKWPSWLGHRSSWSETFPSSKGRDVSVSNQSGSRGPSSESRY